MDLSESGMTSLLEKFILDVVNSTLMFTGLQNCLINLLTLYFVTDQLKEA